MPKPYPAEFRRDVIEFARAHPDQSKGEVARSFGIAPSCLQRWMAAEDAIERGERPTHEESAQVKELRKRMRTLEQENEILRRAAAFFAKDIAPK